jgi:hypothetical protein
MRFGTSYTTRCDRLGTQPLVIYQVASIVAAGAGGSFAVLMILKQCLQSTTSAEPVGTSMIPAVKRIAFVFCLPSACRSRRSGSAWIVLH